MALRLIQVYIPNASWEDVAELTKETPPLNHWHDEYEDLLRVEMLVSTETAGHIVDMLEKRFGHRDRFSLMLLPVEAALPRPKEPEEDESQGKTSPPKKEEEKPKSLVIREELYEDISAILQPSSNYLALVLLSSLVAGIGILRNNTAIVIGAMVIAPLLGPNVALALATTLADWKLARRSLKALGLGVFVAFLISAVWGLLVGIGPDTPGLAQRIYVGPGDIVLAIASGCAGVLFVAAGAEGGLVGVMVAVALLPPLVTCGLSLGSRYMEGFAGALLVFLTNVICINLAGVLTFLLKGVRPLTWWETQKAKKASWLAIGLWVLLLLALAGMIYLSRSSPAAD